MGSNDRVPATLNWLAFSEVIVSSYSQVPISSEKCAHPPRRVNPLQKPQRVGHPEPSRLAIRTMVDKVPTGTAERYAALEMLQEIPGSERVTVGGNKGFDTADFVRECRAIISTAGVHLTYLVSTWRALQ
jgi:hypothetical protein